MLEPESSEEEKTVIGGVYYCDAVTNATVQKIKRVYDYIRF